MKIGLGTAQFGFSYGVSNQQGKVSQVEVRSILECASVNHIEVLDTAALYGESETVLGKCLPSVHKFKFVTKTPALKGYRGAVSFTAHIRDTFMASLEKLSSHQIYGLLVHHADDLTGGGGKEVADCVRELKQQGLVQKIGVSVYDAAQIDAVLDRMVPDIIQLPLNPFDQRLLKSGHLRRLKEAGVEVHARSLFLQGLLLMNPSTVPTYFRPITDHIVAYGEFLKSNDLSRIQGALCFMQQQCDVDVALVGVTTREELEEIVNSVDAVSNRTISFSDFALNDDAFINPAKWKTG